MLVECGPYRRPTILLQGQAAGALMVPKLLPQGRLSPPHPALLQDLLGLMLLCRNKERKSPCDVVVRIKHANITIAGGPQSWPEAGLGFSAHSD